MIEAELPDGTVLEFPEGTSPDVVQRVVKQHLGVQSNAAPMTRGELWKKEASDFLTPLGAIGGALGQGVGNVVLGAQKLIGKGLEGIGAEQVGQWLQKDAEQGKAKMQGEIQPYENQYPMTVAGSRLGGEVILTLPVGGVLAKGASMLPMTSKAAPLIASLRTGGMSSGALTGGAGLATRVTGGAATGAASGALVSGGSEGAETGAVIGGALPGAGAILRGTGQLAKTAIGGSTGAGEASLTQAFNAGKTGGATGKSFADALRGNSSMDDVLTAAKQNLSAMVQQKQAAYRQGMGNIKNDKTVLSLRNIDKAVDDAIGMATYKGQIKNERAASALSKIKEEIDNWKSLDPAEFHTPEGIDALKQKIGGIVEEIPFEQKTARSASSKVYDSIKSEISNQAPEYSKVMKDYSEASDLIKEIERSLTGNQKTSADTAMRKLQSIMRNNVNTNYGQRTMLAEELQKAGGQEFIPALAGQALNQWAPRGIQGALSGTGGAGLVLTGNIPSAAGLAAVSSPRLMGETFYGAGKAAGAVNPALVQALRKSVYSSAPVVGQQ